MVLRIVSLTAIILGIVSASLLIAGCGDEPSSGGDVKFSTVYYLGKELHCINFRGGSHGSFSGVTCDFDRYWIDNRQP